MLGQHRSGEGERKREVFNLHFLSLARPVNLLLLPPSCLSLSSVQVLQADHTECSLSK